jgi:hypothetical protein
MQHGFVAVRICGYYNFESIFCIAAQKAHAHYLRIISAQGKRKPTSYFSATGETVFVTWSNSIVGFFKA